MTDPLAEARQLIADERAHFLNDTKSVLTEVERFSGDLAAAIGEISRHQAMDAFVRCFMDNVAQRMPR